MFLKYQNKLHEQKSVPVSGTLTLLLIFINALILKEGYIHHETLNPLLFITVPLLLASISFHLFKRHRLEDSDPVLEQAADEWPQKMD